MGLNRKKLADKKMRELRSQQSNKPKKRVVKAAANFGKKANRIIRKEMEKYSDNSGDGA